MRSSKKENTNKIIILGHIGVGQKGFVYSQQGICSTIPTWKDPIKVVYKVSEKHENK